MYFSRSRSISFCTAQLFSFWVHSRPGQSCWMSLKIVHSLLNKEAAWLHYCTVAMSQVYKSRKFHLCCTDGCSFSLVLLSSFSLPPFLLCLPPSFPFLSSFFFSPSSFPSLSFTFFLTKLSCEAQTLRTRWTAVKACLFQPSKARQINSRSLASYLDWGRFQQVWAESRLSPISALRWHWPHQQEHWVSSFRLSVLSIANGSQLFYETAG